MYSYLAANVATLQITCPITFSRFLGGYASGGYRNFYGVNVDAQKMYISAATWRNDGVLTGNENNAATPIFGIVIGFI